MQWYGCLGRHPRTHTMFSGIVQFKDTHPRGPNTSFLAHGVQWYGWLGRHPRTHTIFSGIVQFKDTHHRDPKSSFLAHDLSDSSGGLVASLPPCLSTYFFCISHCKHTPFSSALWHGLCAQLCQLRFLAWVVHQSLGVGGQRVTE